LSKISKRIEPKIQEIIKDRIIMAKEVAKGLFKSQKPKQKVTYEVILIKVLESYGIVSDFTLEEISLMFDITRERTRQIEDAAIRKMKFPKYSRNLSKWIDEKDIIIIEPDIEAGNFS